LLESRLEDVKSGAWHITDNQKASPEFTSGGAFVLYRRLNTVYASGDSSRQDVFLRGGVSFAAVARLVPVLPEIFTGYAASDLTDTADREFARNSVDSQLAPHELHFRSSRSKRTNTE
jgi:hypothetical protein